MLTALAPWGVVDQEVDAFILFALFTTMTNVNFAATRFDILIQQAIKVRDNIKARYQEAAGTAAETLSGPAADDVAQLEHSAKIQVNAGHEIVGEDVSGLRMLALYGLKGVAAYCHHARVLGQQDDAVDAEIERVLDYLANDPTDIEEILGECMAIGQLNIKVMELLDAANTGAFGPQEISQVRISPVAGKAILVSGHELHDLRDILEQTKNRNINIYTHGEMLPANAYPGLKQYPHLVGNYGGAWQDQQREFADFPGPIVLTSNCIIEPAKSYRQRIFTTGPVGWPGVRHINDGNYAPVIQAAMALPGFKKDAEEKTITTGFARHTVMSVADKIIDAVKTGTIKHFFVIGGCDGAAPGRNYYSKLAEQTPDDTVILTMGCAKYRFNKNDYGEIGGIPRLLDLGQCNDSYSALQIANALADAFNCGVNDLPLSLMVSWFEQKATAVLLSLLSVGVKGIHLGPTLPVYLTPSVISVLQERFDLRTNGDPTNDISMAMQKIV